MGSCGYFCEWGDEIKTRKVVSQHRLSIRLDTTFAFRFFFFFFWEEHFTFPMDPVHYSWDPQISFFSKTFIKMGPTALFTHLKIILLQYFQFLAFSSIQTDPKTTTPINIFFYWMWILTNPLLNYIFLLSSILAKFQEKKKSIAMSSIKCLNFEFCSLKLYIKNKFRDRIVNNVRLTWNLTCVLRT